MRAFGLLVFISTSCAGMRMFPGGGFDDVGLRFSYLREPSESRRRPQVPESASIALMESNGTEESEADRDASAVALMKSNGTEESEADLDASGSNLALVTESKTSMDASMNSSAGTEGTVASTPAQILEADIKAARVRLADATQKEGLEAQINETEGKSLRFDESAKARQDIRWSVGWLAEARRLQIEAIQKRNRERPDQLPEDDEHVIKGDGTTCKDNRLWKVQFDRNYTFHDGYKTTVGDYMDCSGFMNEGLCIDPAWFGQNQDPCVPRDSTHFMGENFSSPEHHCCACGKAKMAYKVCEAFPLTLPGSSWGVSVSFVSLLLALRS